MFAALKQKVVALGGVAWHRRQRRRTKERASGASEPFSSQPWASERASDATCGGRVGGRASERSKETVTRSIRGGDQLNRDPPRADIMSVERSQLADIIFLLVAINRCR